MPRSCISWQNCHLNYNSTLVPHYGLQVSWFEAACRHVEKYPQQSTAQAHHITLSRLNLRDWWQQNFHQSKHFATMVINTDSKQKPHEGFIKIWISKISTQLLECANSAFKLFKLLQNSHLIRI